MNLTQAEPAHLVNCPAVIPIRELTRDSSVKLLGLTHVYPGSAPRPDVIRLACE